MSWEEPENKSMFSKISFLRTKTIPFVCEKDQVCAVVLLLILGSKAHVSAVEIRVTVGEGERLDFHPTLFVEERSGWGK